MCVFVSNKKIFTTALSYAKPDRFKWSLCPTVLFFSLYLRKPFLSFHCNKTGNQALGLHSGGDLRLLQGLIVLLENSPGFRGHEAVRRVLALSCHLPHARAWNEVVVLVAAGNKRAQRNKTWRHGCDEQDRARWREQWIIGNFFFICLLKKKKSGIQSSLKFLN